MVNAVTNEQKSVGTMMASLLSAADCARLCGGSGPMSSAELNEQIGLLLWWLQGDLSPEERQEAYQRLKELLSRKYAGRPIKKTQSKANSATLTAERRQRQNCHVL